MTSRLDEAGKPLSYQCARTIALSKQTGGPGDAVDQHNKLLPPLKHYYHVITCIHTTALFKHTGPGDAADQHAKLLPPLKHYLSCNHLHTLPHCLNTQVGPGDAVDQHDKLLPPAGQTQTLTCVMVTDTFIITGSEQVCVCVCVGGGDLSRCACGGWGGGRLRAGVCGGGGGGEIYNRCEHAEVGRGLAQGRCVCWWGFRWLLGLRVGHCVCVCV